MKKNTNKIRLINDFFSSIDRTSYTHKHKKKEKAMTGINVPEYSGIYRFRKENIFKKNRPYNYTPCWGSAHMGPLASIRLPHTVWLIPQSSSFLYLNRCDKSFPLVIYNRKDGPARLLYGRGIMSKTISFRSVRATTVTSRKPFSAAAALSTRERWYSERGRRANKKGNACWRRKKKDMTKRTRRASIGRVRQWKRKMAVPDV